MSFFDQEEPKKPKKQKQPGAGGGRRNRNKNKQQKEEQKSQNKPPQKRFVFPPLMIKEKSTLLTQEEIEKPLQDYVNEIYDSFGNQKHNKVIQSFEEEDDDGNIEYKYKLVNPSEDRMDHLATQMKYRLGEGSQKGYFGQAYYRIGVEDDGRPTGLCREDMLESLKTICYLSTKVQAEVIVLRVGEGIKGLFVELLIQKIQRQGVKMEIRLLLFGQSGSGKSTLLGVLKSGEKDDGKGYSRVKVFTHKKEFMTGMTQTKSHHVIGFDAQGQLYNQQSMMSLEKWFDNANKLLSFIDVGGHKKAQKQLVSSLCSFFPEYALWIVSGKCNNGQKNEGTISETSTNNVQLAKMFNLPLIVVITHLDQMTKDEEIEAIYNTKEVLKKLYPDKTPISIKDMESAVLFSRITSTQGVIPIFMISNVTGANFDLLTNFLNLLPSASELKNNEDMFTEFSISDKYVVDKNIILAGTVIKGSIKKGQILHIGPDLKGTFRAIQVVSIECLRVPVKLAKCGQVCTIAIRLLNYSKEWLEKQPNAIRRGMVLIESKTNPRAAYEFLAEFKSYVNSKEEIKITEKYQPVINTLTTRQICNIVNLKPQQQKITLPDFIMTKKKSKSIGHFKKHDDSEPKKMHNQSIDMRKKSRPERSKGKISLDLTQSYEGQTEKKSEKQALNSEKKLQPIVQEVPKRRRQPQQIRFPANATTPLRLRFKYNPQYITLGQKIVINELKLVGRIKEIYY